MTYRGAYGDDEELRYGDRYGDESRRYIDDYAGDPSRDSRRWGDDSGVGRWRWRGHTDWQGHNPGAAWHGPAGDRGQDWYEERRWRSSDWRGSHGIRPASPGLPGFGPYGGAGDAYEPFWQTSGPYVGKGPKGYQRSDERIREDINDRLTEHGMVDASDITVSVSNGIVVLQGEIDDRRQKRLAEDIADSVAGVRDVRNELHVRGHAVWQAEPQAGTQ